MNVDETRPVFALLSGFWPNPTLTQEETVAWVSELVGRLRITPEEAKTVLTQFAESGIDDAKFRPKAGQIVSMVQALRRRRALERPVAALMPAVEFGDDHDTIRAEVLAAARAALAAGAQEAEQRRSQRLQLARSAK